MTHAKNLVSHLLMGQWEISNENTRIMKLFGKKPQIISISKEVGNSNFINTLCIESEYKYLW